jgi:hypothetical protein
LSQLRHLGFNMGDKGGGKDITLVQVVVTAINNQDTISAQRAETSIVNTLLRAVRWP